ERDALQERHHPGDRLLPPPGEAARVLGRGLRRKPPANRVTAAAEVGHAMDRKASAMEVGVSPKGRSVWLESSTDGRWNWERISINSRANLVVRAPSRSTAPDVDR